ncbi:unnamed protein product [Caenorhabditis nigoni]
MINGRFRREKADYDSLTFEEKALYDFFKKHCPTDPNKCDPVPYDTAIQECYYSGHLSNVGKKEKTYDFEKLCKEKANEKIFREYCKEAKDEVASCYKFYSTTSANLVPFIIGGVVGVIVILAIGIGIFCYCKKKKSAGKGQSMTGTTVGGTTVTGATTKTGTKTNTGTAKAGTTTAAPTARY